MQTQSPFDGSEKSDAGTEMSIIKWASCKVAFCKIRMNLVAFCSGRHAAGSVGTGGGGEGGGDPRVAQSNRPEGTMVSAIHRSVSKKDKWYISARPLVNKDTELE